MLRKKTLKHTVRRISRKGYLKRQKTKKRVSKKKQVSISKLIKEADRLFSLIVRQNFANDDGIQTCYTCGFKNHFKKLHCGHYLSRYYKAARWDFDNCRPQCVMCNLWKKGDIVTFRQNLVKEIGLERVEMVEKKRDQLFKLSREYLENLIKELQMYGKT